MPLETVQTKVHDSWVMEKAEIIESRSHSKEAMSKIGIPLLTTALVNG